jgi:predicted DNA-binding helix-hairpin-helix protein
MNAMTTASISDTLSRMTRMGDVTLYEPAGDQPLQEAAATHTGERFQARSLADCITAVSTPTGKKPILKTMLTTACERNCYYCPFRAGRSRTERATLRPDDLAKAFDALQHSGQVDGLFLSSGIVRGSVTTQDKIIDAVEIIRKRYAYRGYIHLKLMPGAEYDQVFRAMQLADRISVNLEGANQQRLSALAPKKDFERELVQLLRWAAQIRHENPHLKLARPVTQFVVGAVGDTDVELLSTTQRLHQQVGLVRAYFSAFRPVEQTPLENTPPTDPLREYRLYQASFLLRDYGWEVEELPFSAEGSQLGNLRLDVDPKRAWADAHLSFIPVEVMTASREQLMRVPGIGPRTADLILAARQKGTLRDLNDLRKVGVRGPERSAPYITLAGRKVPVQMALAL